MVAVQVMLMNYFLLSLHTDSHINNDILPSTDIDDVVDCSSSCSSCSPVNGCLMCKPPFVLVLRRKGPLQSGSCREFCPKGFFSTLFSNISICIKCDIKGCKDCFSETVCVKCRHGYERVKNKCVKKCPSGYSYDSYCRKCTKIRKEHKDNCSAGCSKCSPVNGCLQCRPPFVLTLLNEGLHQKGSCRRCCPPGSRNYFIGNNRLCFQSDRPFNATTDQQTESNIANYISKYPKDDFRKYRKKKRRRKKKKRRNREKILKKLRRQKKKLLRKAKKMNRIRHCRTKMRKGKRNFHRILNKFENSTMTIKI